MKDGARPRWCARAVGRGWLSWRHRVGLVGCGWRPMLLLLLLGVLVRAHGAQQLGGCPSGPHWGLQMSMGGG